VLCSVQQSLDQKLSLRYLKTTLQCNLQFFLAPPKQPPSLKAFCDADWTSMIGTLVLRVAQVPYRVVCDAQLSGLVPLDS
jgi:hypothetical protein